ASATVRQACWRPRCPIPVAGAPGGPAATSMGAPSGSASRCVSWAERTTCGACDALAADHAVQLGVALQLAYLALARPLVGHQLCGIAVEQVDPMLQPVHILPFEAVEDELPDVLVGLSDLADVVGIHHADGLGEREQRGPGTQHLAA